MSWNLPGGGGSGKTYFIFEMVIFLLPEIEDHKALVLLGNATHQLQVADKFCDHLSSIGYPYSRKVRANGDIWITYGNNNSIVCRNAITNTIAQIKDKMKTLIVNDKSFKFVIWEEFTSALNGLRTFDTYDDIKARIMRQLADGAIIFHLYNPPNESGLIDVFEKEHDGKTLMTTIYKQPIKFQDEHTMAEAEALKIRNNKRWRNVYMGERVKLGNVAFNYSYPIVVNNWNENSFIDRQIFIDYGDDDSVAFGVFGRDKIKNVYMYDNYYYSPRESGYKKLSDHVEVLIEYIKASNKKFSAIVADSKTFVVQFNLSCKERGYIWRAKMPSKKKDAGNLFRENQLRFTRSVLDREAFFICKVGSWEIFFEQISNAKAKDGKIAKVDNNSMPETHQLHGLDTITYYIVANYKEIITQRSINGY